MTSWSTAEALRNPACEWVEIPTANFAITTQQSVGLVCDALLAEWSILARSRPAPVLDLGIKLGP